DTIPDEGERKNIIKALEYMGLQSGKSLIRMPVQHVFIGSCTNSRIEDLRSVAALIKGKKKNDSVQVMIVPGS
ncbi:aconitase family protein, partial [Streptococcus pneumoniae]|uniref:aconitase family protein n=1 Tax=Streptococcus pneumoniae TaxID=1313 RepID=UPI001EF99E0C